MEPEKTTPMEDAAAFLQRVDRLDKAAKAELRHACGKSLNEASAKALFAFYRCYPPKGNYKEAIYFTAACIHCMNVTPLKKISLENYLKIALTQNESLSNRITRLLDTEYDPEDGILTGRLLDICRMAKKDSYELDCPPIIQYLSNWNNDTQWVQKRIARACFGPCAINN